MTPIQSFGAAQTVTGSCHLLTFKNGPKILVDCGMFQGQTEHKSDEPFGFDPKEIDILLITHAHLDHVGRIPKLVKEGFDGRIVTTRATMELAEVILLDSAKIAQEDYETALKKARRRSEESKVKEPIYRSEDVRDVFDLSIQYAEYDKPIRLTNEISTTFRNAGHILGSATIELHYQDEQGDKYLVFSGDLGNKLDLAMPSPEPVPRATALYLESTYGDRNHRELKDSIAEFKEVVQHTLENQGNIIIPSFAIERTQELLILLKQMYLDGELENCKVFLDSPMAIKATRIYNQHHRELNPAAQKLFDYDDSVFDFPALNYSLSGQDSILINSEESRNIIIAGSGMCNGGRILHHFKHRLWNERNSVIFVGFQAYGTLGRLLVDGAETIKVYGETIKVNAQIHMINGFSAHADQEDMLQWMQQFQQLDKVFLVHGEPDKQAIFKEAIEQRLNKTVHIVEFAEEVWV